MSYPRFTKIIINHFFSKHQSLTKLQYLHTHIIKDDGIVIRLKFVRIGEDCPEYGLHIPETMLTERIKQSESYQMFIKYSTGQIPPKKSRGKGPQGKKTAYTPEAVVDVSKEFDSKPDRKKTANRRVIKKKVTIYVDDNIIPDPDVALELGKSISLTKATEEEAARQFHATHAKIMTESVHEPARRRPSGIAFRDTSRVSKKVSLDPSKKLKGTRGSSEGTGRISRVPDESTVILATLSEGTSTKPGVLDEEKVTSEANVILEWGSKQESEYSKEGDDDEMIEWVDTYEEEEKKDDDDDKSINLEQTNDEETDDKFVHGEEHVQDNDEETDDEFIHGNKQVNDDEDEEMTNVEFEESRNSDAKITDTAMADAEKTEEVKDDTKKVEFPPISTSLSVSSSFGDQFLKLSSDTSLIGTVMDTTNAEINSLLDVKIQKETPHIQSPSILKISMSLKEVNQATTLPASLRAKIPSAMNAYLGTSLADALQKVLQRYTEELIQKYSPQASYKEVIEESVQANLINEVKNQLPQLLPKAVSNFTSPVIQSNVKNALKNTSLLVAQSSSQAQSPLKAALSFSKYELKIILFEKMDKSRSNLTHDKHQALFDALINSMNPSARPNQSKKTKRSRTKESKPTKKSSTSKESSKGKSPAKTSKSSKSMTIEEPVEEPVFEMASNDIEQTIDDAVNDVDQPHDESTQAKDIDPKKDWFKQPLRPLTPDPE
ncbi:hypothetical protein Tco_1578048 [Tanacetum coccineum]